MHAITGVFVSKIEAEQAVSKLRAAGLSPERVTLLTPAEQGKTLESVPVDTAEQPGMGTALGSVIGGAAGLSGFLALVPGVGIVTAIGVLGAAVLTAAGAGVGAVVGSSLENATTEGLPEDEIFVYEDALRKGRSVVIALVEDAAESKPIGEILESQGAEDVDSAREQWWIGLRNAEQERYLKSGRNFSDDEKFFRLGFEAALHARTRCKEFDQVSSEMNATLEELQRQYPGVDLEAPFTHGYERGREYYQHLCEESKESKAA